MVRTLTNEGLEKIVAGDVFIRVIGLVRRQPDVEIRQRAVGEVFLELAAPQGPANV